MVSINGESFKPEQWRRIAVFVGLHNTQLAQLKAGMEAANKPT